MCAVSGTAGCWISDAAGLGVSEGALRGVSEDNCPIVLETVQVLGYLQRLRATIT
jgi:hypothetical protein